MTEPVKHHFLPVFYLKNWCSDGGRLVEFSKPFRNDVKPKRVHPKGTGYIDKLYAVEGLPGAISHEVEKNFLSPVDSRASTALKMLVNGEVMRDQDRKAWSHFLVTLLMRMPTEITLLKELIKKIDFIIGQKIFEAVLRHTPKEYHEEFQKGFEELKSSTISRSVKNILKIMSNEGVTKRLSQMEWSVLNLDSAPHELLTSDRPVVVVRNDRIAGNTVIALPVAPRKLFVAATNRNLIKELQVNPKKVAAAMNMEVVTGAQRFVYGSTDRQLSFVQNHFGTSKEPTFVENALKESGLNADKISTYLSILDDNSIRQEFDAALAQRTAMNL